MKGTEHDQVLKQIAAGAYRDRYLIYARKSTDDADNQKNSIAYQKAEDARFARRAGLSIASLTLPGFCTDGVVAEHHSGFKEATDLTFGDDNTVKYRVERPKFHQLVRFLAARQFKGVIFLCWDRASRNKGDDTILRKLMRAGVDIRFALAQYERTSSGELHMDIDGMFAEHHSRVTREKVTLTIRASRGAGLCTNRAPIGYLNVGRMDWKPRDPERATIIIRLFELADEANWSLSNLQRWAVQQGLTMQPMRRRRTADELLAQDGEGTRSDEKLCRLPTRNNIHRILTNPFYTGRVPGNDGAWVKSASHEALVSDELFDRVQAKLTGRRTSIRYEKNLPHPFRGFVRCPCGRLYTPYEQKGIVYYGARCDRSCPNPFKIFNLKHLLESVDRLLHGLPLSEAEASLALDTVTEEEVRERGETSGEAQKDRRRRKLKEDIVYLADNRLTVLRVGLYTPAGLAAEEARLREELDDLEAQEATSPAMRKVAVAAAMRLSELLKKLSVTYRDAEIPEKERIARRIISELVLGESSLEYRWRNGFEALGRRLVFVGDPTGWISELAAERESMESAARDIRELMADQVPDVPEVGPSPVS